VPHAASNTWKQSVEQLKAMADPLRIRLLRELVNAPRTVTELAALYDIDIGGLSHHLGVLFRVGLVDRTRQGRFVEYRISAPVAKGDGGPNERVRVSLKNLVIEYLD
jgi:DNA-binding transcriptional ArsR family regulator